MNDIGPDKFYVELLEVCNVDELDDAEVKHIIEHDCLYQMDII